ncbi:hypothetical protein [Brevundimonas sp.]|uniref:hypothetical protein n=1 Tax=Brevundimonas sp. TaxID=1871086 RepID=UPI001DE71FC1|nr:hypothetical protein [Brevundimonas sp.]MBA4000162.1 hypothetical protein [Brevundimonas sp.]
MAKPTSPGTPKKKGKNYTAEIRALDWASLNTLWGKILKGQTPGWPSGIAFEHLVLRAFELEGAVVTWPYNVRLEDQVVEQIDGLVSVDGMIFLAESKDLKTDVNVEPIAKLRNQLLRRPAGVVGCVFSSKGFTLPSKTLAQYMSPQAILLWHGSEIELLLGAKGGFVQALKKKHYWLVRAGVPDFNILVGET